MLQESQNTTNTYHTLKLQELLDLQLGLAIQCVNKEAHILLHLNYFYCYAPPKRMLPNFGGGSQIAYSVFLFPQGKLKYGKIKLKHKVQVSLERD